MLLKTHKFEFGDFLLDTKEFALFRKDEPVSVTPKAFQLLVTLVENHGNLVDKDKLMTAVWADSFVEEGNIAYWVRYLRKTLGDDPQDPQFIETVRKRGYRFIAPVTRVEASKTEEGSTKGSRNGISLVVESSSTDRPMHVSKGPEQLAAVVALADWRDGKDAAESDSETAENGSGFGIPDIKIAPAAILPVRRPLRYYFLAAGVIFVFLLTGLGYGSYRLLNRTADSPRQTSKRLTSNGKTKLAAISPDGKFLAYVIDDEGSQSIWLKNIATESDLQILPANGKSGIDSIRFSPDGEHIFYGAQKMLFRIPILGGTPIKILAEFVQSISFSPDGKQLAFTRFTQNAASVVIVDADGTNAREITQTQPFINFIWSPEWSPNGQVIAFAVINADGYWNVKIVRIADSTVSTLASPQWSQIKQIVWRPDGNSLLVLAIPDDRINYQIWSLAYQGGGATKITDDSHDYESISLTADGSLMVAVRVERDAHLWVLRPDDPAAAKQLTGGFEKYDGYTGIIWTNHDQIFYEAAPGGRFAPWKIDVDGRNAKEILSTSIATSAAPPDGSFLVYQDTDAEGIGLFRLSIRDGQKKRLTNGIDVWPTFSPDGKWIVFMRYADDVALWKVSIDGGEAVKITHLAGTAMYPAVSADGKFVAFYNTELGSAEGSVAVAIAIAVVSIEGGDILKEIDFPVPTKLWPDAATMLQWTPDGQGIYYTDVRDNISNIWRQPLDGSPPAQVTNFQTGRIFNFAYSPDGKQLALSRGIYDRDAVLITNSF